MKKYFKFYSAAWKIGLQYKFDFFMWIFYGAFQILLYFFLWKAIFDNQETIQGYTLQSMISYIMLATLVQIFQPIWHWSNISHLVHTGDIIFELVKPYHFLIRWYFSEMGLRIFNATVMVVPALIIGRLVLHIAMPTSWLNLGAFLLSLFLATLISYSIWTFVGLTSFYITRIWGVFTTFDGLMLFLTGMLIPLDFMPLWLRTILNWLPFKNIIYTPISIYLGRVPAGEIMQVLAVQLGWASVLAVLISLYYRQGLKKIVIQGG